MTNQEIYRIAREQSAIDSSCAAEDFLSRENKVVISQKHEQARKYLELPFFCDLTSYGTNIVASVSEKIAEETQRYIDRYAVEHCFETPNLYILNEALQKHEMAVCFMAEYFLPDADLLRVLPCAYETRVLESADFGDLYVPQWSNALCEHRRELDVLGVGAFDGGRLIGLAGCSADCENMWQIGVDVLPEYRRKGIAAALTSRLAAEILGRGKVPFYCCAWSNVKSAGNAVKSGFRPAWVQVTAKSAACIAELNQK